MLPIIIFFSILIWYFLYRDSIHAGIKLFFDSLFTLPKTPTPTYNPHDLQAQFIKELVRKHATTKEIDHHELQQYLSQKSSYLKSPKWRTIRDKRLHLDNYQCQLCETPHSLNVHHLHYRTLGHESFSDLVTLCQQCHTQRHEQLGYPQTVQQYLAFNDTIV